MTSPVGGLQPRASIAETPFCVRPSANRSDQPSSGFIGKAQSRTSALAARANGNWQRRSDALKECSASLINQNEDLEHNPSVRNGRGGRCRRQKLRAPSDYDGYAPGVRRREGAIMPCSNHLFGGR